MFTKLKERIKLLDKWLFIPFISLMLFSIVMVYSASSYSALEDIGDPNYYLYRQLAFVGVSLFVAAIVYIFPFRALKSSRFMSIATIILLGLLVFVLFMPESLGASRWIPLPGGINIQPAELAKVFVVWYLAFIFSKKQKDLETNLVQTVIKPGILVGLITMLVLIQPDTGTAIIIALMIIMMLSASGASLRVGMGILLIGSILVAVVIFLVYNFGEHIPFLGYRYDRFLGWFDPFGNYQVEGHQLVNSYYALNRGGIFGVGIGNSVQKTGYLPFPYTDFIMAIVGEELGLLGVTFVLIALASIIGRSFYIASKSKNIFNSLICVGVGSMFLVQSLINMGGVTGVLPITGITFPFLSYGGSSLMTVAISVALAANASALERLEKN